MRGTVLSASVLSVALGIVLAATGVVDVDADRPVDRRADRAGADPHPLLRRDVRRARAAAPPLEPGRPGAGDRDADHDGAAGARRQGALPRAELGRGVPARRGALADRPGGHLGRRHLAPGARARSATRSTSSPGSTTAWRCPSSSSSSSSPRPAATPAPKRRSWSARRWSAAVHRRRPRVRSAGAFTTTSRAAGITAALRGDLRGRLRPRRLRARRRDDRQRPDRRLRLRDRDGRRPSATSPRASSSSPRTPARSSRCITFFVFGALIVATGFDHSIPPLVALRRSSRCCVARPVAVLLSFVRTGLPRPQKLFMAWFGPKGVASMLFALFVLKSQRRRRRA